MPMFVYLDESGCTGFKFNRGSSKYFVITLLLVDDPIPIQSVITDLRKRIGFADHEEFKFSRSSNDIRDTFLREIRRKEFYVRSLVVNKELMTRPNMKNRETFYQYLVKLILTHDFGTITDATLVLDESVKDKGKQRAFSTYLRRGLNSDPTMPKVSKIVHHSSHSDNLIQATDMVCGSIFRAYEGGDDRFLALIRPKVQDLWVWRPSN